MFSPEVERDGLALRKISYASVMRPMEFLHVHTVDVKGIFYLAEVSILAKREELESYSAFKKF